MKIVLKIGGSVSIATGGPKFSYFSRLLPVVGRLKKRNQIVVVVGGGKLTRTYGNSIEKFPLSSKEREEIYIELIKANVRFVASLLNMKPIFSLSEIKKNTSGVLGGIAPGRSTDANGAVAAKKIGADVFIKLTDVNSIYTKDPKKFPTARKLDKISFSDMKKIAVKGSPNRYGVLDALAIRTLASAKIKVLVISGKDPENILKVLDGEKIGTVIE